MLPFTTYNIPESVHKEIPAIGKWLWIITPQPLSHDDEALLHKIGAALKANFPDDVHMLTVDSNSDHSLPPFNDPSLKLVLSFGIPPSALGIRIDINTQGIRFLESFAFIFTTSLEELSGSPSSKKELWASMQSFLAIKQ